MSNTIGMGTDILSEWRDAVGGTISDLDLMTGFQTLAAGMSEELTRAFADNNAQLLKISKAASALNPQLGDTAFMYESITRGIKRNSPLILDNLGIIVKVGEANKKLAEELGKSVDELTAEEKQMALLNEVMESGDRIITQLGGAVESATDPWDKFTTALKNNTDRAKKNLAESENLTNALNKSADAMSNSLKWRTLLDKTTELGIFTQGQYTQAVLAVNSGEIELIDSIEWLTNLIDEHNTKLEKSAELTEGWALANDQGYAAAKNMAAGVDSITASISTANNVMSDYTKNLQFQMAAEGLDEEQKIKLAKAMGLYNEQSGYAAAITDMLRRRAESGVITWDMYYEAVANLNGEVAAMQDKETTVTVNVRGNNLSLLASIAALKDKNINIGINTTSLGNTSANLNPNAQTRAIGGPINANQPYLVGERGPELIVPNTSGQVIPNDRLGGGDITNNYNINATIPQDEIVPTLEQLKVMT